jgi:hypothetical protein
MSKQTVLGHIQASAGIGVSVPSLKTKTGMSEGEIQGHLDALLEDGLVVEGGTMRDPITSMSVTRYVVAQGGAKRQSEIEAMRRLVESKVKGLNLNQLKALSMLIDTTIKKL